MTDTSLHTKYRPTKLEAVVGQHAAVKSLKRTIADNRQHSFIFSGPAGCGKTSLARIMASMFAGGLPTAANVEEIPAADKTGVGDMREIVRRAHYRAMGGSPVKTIILAEAPRLTGAAWDERLKPIEEPPDHVYWVFCTTNPTKIPKTIQTRCIRFELKPVDEASIFELLDAVATKESFNLSDEVLEAIAEGSDGSPRQALVHLEACLSCKTSYEARHVMRNASFSLESANLAKFLMQPTGVNWVEAMKRVKSLEGMEAESIRIGVVNYLAAVLGGIKSEQKARPLLSLLEAFSTPYVQSDRMAPLLRSIGLALNLEQ